MRFQIIISICAGIIPIIAVLLLAPKKKLKSGAGKIEAKEKKEEKPLSEKDKNLKNVEKSYEDYKKSLDEDFKRYAISKTSSTSKPEMKSSTDGKGSPADDFCIIRRDPLPNQTASKTVIEEFNNSSDELKTLIISGFLDKKDY